MEAAWALREKFTTQFSVRIIRIPLVPTLGGELLPKRLEAGGYIAG